VLGSQQPVGQYEQVAIVSAVSSFGGSVDVKLLFLRVFINNFQVRNI
jgi:hypothetical protein